MLNFKVFDNCPVQTFLSRKLHGDMKNSEQNRLDFLKSLNIDPKLLFSAQQQVHSNEVYFVDKDNLNARVDCDAFITKEPGLVISVRVADCLPIYIYDSQNSAVAMIHAGWRGLEQHIIKKTIAQLGKPEGIKVGIGPCIQSCHFEVQNDLVSTFADYPECIEKIDEKFFLNLPKIAQTQLLNLGLLSENIELSSECTFESEEMFSYRRDKPTEAEVMLAGIRLSYSSSSS